MKNKLFSLLLAALLALSLAVPALAAGGAETVYLDTAEDLLLFAANCRLDTWSQGRRIVLRADISLAGADFEPIPSFGGDFVGGGHTISALRLSSGVAPAGLFAVVQPGASVSGLHVSGAVTPAGAAEDVGGLVGVNYGAISGCSFSGSVAGQTHVGGIAGVNAVTGTISDCATQGSVSGVSAVGGVVGSNLGTVDGCVNRALVNTAGVDSSLQLSDLSGTLALGMSALLSLDSLHTATDTGGVAGYSAGTLQSCRNEAAVGYPHSGYNTGGVVGRSCGYIVDCENSGAVYGRKDIGGIAGQMEPFILMSLADDVLEELRREMDELNTLVDTALGDANSSVGSVTARLNSMAGYVASAGAALGKLDVPTVTVPDTPPSGEEIGEIIGGAAEAGSQIDVNAALSRLSGAVNGISSQIRLLSGEIAGGSGALTRDCKAINEKVNAITAILFDAAADARESKLSDYVSDTSELDIEAVTLGKTRGCVNRGDVAGDINVGGIAGSMAMEYSLDPEDDVSSELDLSTSRQYELKAIVQGCVNRGTVSARKDFAGGLCGRMDLGLIDGGESYGAVSSEGGSYVGGVAGVAKSTVRRCWARCTLAGKSCVGGIVGSGYTDETSGAAATVAGCVSLVKITACGQYAGAISGCDAGSFAENVFVSDTLSGVNGRSYAGQAEPIRYAQLKAREGLPEEFLRFTLRFLAGDAVLKSVDFDYGDTLSARVYPELPAREGCTAAWDVTELRMLHFDTDVTAVYTPYVTSLAGGETRASGRPAFYAEGGFAPGAALETALLDDARDGKLAAQEVLLASDARGPLPGLRIGRELIETWRVTLPADGAASHTLRFLPPAQAGEHPALFLRGADGVWRSAPAETVGSYLRFEAAGETVELAVLSTASILWLWLLLPGAALALVLTALLRQRQRKKKAAVQPASPAAQPPVPAADAAAAELPAAAGAGDAESRPAAPAAGGTKKKKRRARRIVALALALLLLAGGAVALRPGSGLRGALTAIAALRRFDAQESFSAALTVDAALGSRDYESELALFRSRAEGQKLTAIRQKGVTLYYAEGLLLLENGRAYAVGAGLPDASRALGLAARLFRDGGVVTGEESRGTLYTLAVPGEDAAALAALLLPEAAETLAVESAQLAVLCDGGSFLELRAALAGTLGADAAPFTLNAVLRRDASAAAPAVPEAVRRALAAGAGATGEITDDVLRFLSAAAQLAAQDPLRARITLAAACPPLSLTDSLSYTRTRVGGAELGCVERSGERVYFSGGAACDENGRAVSAALAGASVSSRLVDLGYQLLMNGELTCLASQDETLYTLTLGEADMAVVAEAIAPEAARLDPRLTSGTLRATLRGDKLTRLEFICTGSIPVVLTTAAVSLSAALELDYSLQSLAVPDAVGEALGLAEK